MGFSLLTFAGEARLGRQDGADTTSSEQAIRRILLAFERLDGSAEAARYGTSEPGFFLRDDATAATVQNHRPGGGWGLGESDFTAGEAHVPAMSVDQTIHMFVGWWAVVRWSADAANVNLARAQMVRVMEFLMRSGYTITLPDGGLIPADRGRDFRPAAGFLTEIASQATGRDYMHDSRNAIKFEILGRDVLGALTLGSSEVVEAAERWITGSGFGDMGRIAVYVPVSVSHPLVENSLATLDSALMIDLRLNDFLPGWLKNLAVSYPTTEATTWWTDTPFGRVSTDGFKVVWHPVSVGDLLDHIRVRIGDKVSPYVRQLILASAAFSDAAVVRDHFASIALQSNNPWAVALRSAVHGETVPPAFADWLQQLLAAMPASGPNDGAGTEWSSDSRWVRCTARRDDHGNSNRQYNGLDFLSAEVLLRLGGRQPLNALQVGRVMQGVLGPIDFEATVNGQPAFYGHWRNRYMDHAMNVSYAALVSQVRADHGK